MSPYVLMSEEKKNKRKNNKKRRNEIIVGTHQGNYQVHGTRGRSTRHGRM